MLKITSLGGQTLLCENSRASVLLFPEGKPAVNKTTTVLLSEPQDVSVEDVVSWPGEYDYGGVIIRGLHHNDHVSYIVTIDNIRCGFLSPPLKEWSEDDIESLGDLDVLAVPGEDVKKVQSIVEDVDPRVVILPKAGAGKTFNEVVTACGGKEVETVKEVKLKKSSLPTESREVYVLELA